MIVIETSWFTKYENDMCDCAFQNGLISSSDFDQHKQV